MAPSLLKNGDAGIGCKKLQSLGAQYRVAMLIQFGRPNRDGHLLGNDGHNAATYATLGRDTHAKSKITHCIVGSASLHQGIHPFGFAAA